jgi:hypothetical protein
MRFLPGHGFGKVTLHLLCSWLWFYLACWKGSQF